MNIVRQYWSWPTILALLILAGGAALRFSFADVNSYWLDELYSVVLFGVDHDSAVDAILYLSRRSIHPPLYQCVLYNWMSVFGDSEFATRTLSNLYILGATLCIYLSVRRVYGAWLGVIVALAFTLSYTPTYYGMETRSYAQTIFLTALSTLCLIHALPRMVEKSWRHLVRDGWLYALLASNFALLMTHYYNLLFLAAQGLFLIIYLLFRSDFRNAIAKSLAVGITPPVLLLLSWGPVIIATYSKKADNEKYLVEHFPMAPWNIFSEMVLEPNLHTPFLYYLALILVVFLTLLTAMRFVQRSHETTLFTLWFLLATIAPALLAFAVFYASGHERYSSRYFAFSVGPLVILVVLGAREVVAAIGRAMALPTGATLVATAAIAVSLFLPGSLYALQKPKADWRGIARDIVARIEREPAKSFALYETTSRSYPTLNYYLSRYSDSIRVFETLTRKSERRQHDLTFNTPKTDYAIIAFTHQTTSDFPTTLKILGSQMDLSENHVEHGRGYLVYTVP